MANPIWSSFGQNLKMATHRALHMPKISRPEEVRVRYTANLQSVEPVRLNADEPPKENQSSLGQ